MKQFHAYRLETGELVVNLQADLAETGTRMLAPLHERRTVPHPIATLEPVIAIDATPYVLRTSTMVAFETRKVEATFVADLTAHDYEIKRALDFLFSGF